MASEVGEYPLYNAWNFIDEMIINVLHMNDISICKYTHVVTYASLSLYIYTCIYVYLQIHRYIVADEYLEPGFEKIC